MATRESREKTKAQERKAREEAKLDRQTSHLTGEAREMEKRRLRRLRFQRKRDSPWGCALFLLIAGGLLVLFVASWISLGSS